MVVNVFHLEGVPADLDGLVITADQVNTGYLYASVI